jgi:hypothetical protein
VTLSNARAPLLVVFFKKNNIFNVSRLIKYLHNFMNFTL